MELEPTIQDAFGIQTNYNDPGLAAAIMSMFRRGDFMTNEQLFQKLYNEGNAVSDNYEFRGVIDGIIKTGRLTRIIEDGKVVYVRKI